MSAERCRHDMLAGTCAMCQPRPPAARRGPVLVCFDGTRSGSGRLHELDCPHISHEGVDRPWRTARWAREYARQTGVERCGHCQPVLS